MHEKAREHLLLVMEGAKGGQDTACKYFPCHHEDQDCTFCFCPFYPCDDGRTGGKTVIGKRSGRPVWSCIDCTWIHKEDVAREVLEGLENMGGIDNWDAGGLIDMRARILDTNPKR